MMNLYYLLYITNHKFICLILKTCPRYFPGHPAGGPMNYSLLWIFYPMYTVPAHGTWDNQSSDYGRAYPFSNEPSICGFEKRTVIVLYENIRHRLAAKSETILLL